MSVEFIKIAEVDGEGAWVPVVNDLHIHSTRDPFREAANVVDKEWSKIKDVDTLVVLGLGGGFHAYELLKRKPFELIVIEAEKVLADSLQEKWPSLARQITVYSGLSSETVIESLQAAGVFQAPYGIFKHPASLRVSPLYYGDLLKKLCGRTLSELKNLTAKNQRLHSFFETLDINAQQILTLPMMEEALKRRHQGVDREALIWLTLRELVV